MSFINSRLEVKLLKKTLFILLVLILTASAIAWKPTTHVYLVSKYNEDVISPAGAIAPDITTISGIKAPTHNPGFIENLDKYARTPEERLFYQAYHHHIHMDPKENVYNSKYYERLKHDYPGYSDNFYKECISYGAEFFIAEKYPDILTAMVASAGQEEVLDSFSDFLLRYDPDAGQKVADFQERLLMYTSALELKQYELIMERELEEDLNEKKWNEIMQDSMYIASQEFEDFARITNSKPPVSNWLQSDILNKSSGSFSLVKGSSTSSEISNYINQNPDVIPTYFSSYDQVVLMYVEENPSKIAMIVLKFAINNPGATIKFLLNPKAGLAILIVLLLIAVTPAFIVYHHMKGYKKLGQNLKNVVYRPTATKTNTFYFPSMIQRIKWGNILMLLGIIIFFLAVSYDYLFSDNLEFGGKQWMGFFIGLGIIIFGYMGARGIPSLVKLYRYSKQRRMLVSGAILATGIAICLLILSYDMIKGYNFSIGYRQITALFVSIMIMASAFMYSLKKS